jgi:VanZ family protein
LLGGWTALIASASLYPFDGQLRLLTDALIAGLPKLREWRDPSQRDTIVNLLLYVPLGLLGYMALEKSRSVVLRVFLPISAASILSLGVEVAQHALPARDPSLADWIFNIVSAGLGTVLAMLYSALPVRPLSRRLQRLAIGPAPALLVALWLIAHLAPFVPRLRPGRIEAAIETSLAIPFEPGKMFGFFACYLVLGTLVDTLLRRPYFWSALLSLFAVSLGARHPISPRHHLFALTQSCPLGITGFRRSLRRTFSSGCLAVDPLHRVVDRGPSLAAICGVGRGCG